MPDAELKPRSSIVNKLLNSQRADTGAVEERLEAFQEARARSREAIMLDVMLPDGTIESFDYTSLRRVRYRPDGTMLLRFGPDEVRLKGTNLLRLREAITEHRVRFVKKGTDAELDLKADDAAYIETIEITEGDEEL